MAEANSTTKRCSRCGQLKPLTCFYWTTRRNGERARHSRCKACRKEQFREWAKRPHSKLQKRARRLAREYQLSESDYAQMLDSQGGGCAICGAVETSPVAIGPGVRRLAVDHDHETGDVRGILCNRCNQGLGRFADDPERLRRAADYLERSSRSLAT